MYFYIKIVLFIASLTGSICFSFAQTDNTFWIFQFPADQTPRIDGNSEDWFIVPEEYYIGTEYLVDDEIIHSKPDSSNLDVNVCVGWVKGMNRLYFLYEAYDDYWDFSRTDLRQDIFEVVVDGDKSGGPFIEKFHPKRDSLDNWDLFFSFHGVHAQNYHIFTPSRGKDWCMLWGSQQWIKKLPFANYAYSYDFEPGEPGKLLLEFWITPFDSAFFDGPESSVESLLSENGELGISWAVIDFDNVESDTNNGFWNLSDQHTMYGNASHLRSFRLMPLDKKYKDQISADWSFEIIDRDNRLVAFNDLSEGEISSWKWDFDDGTTSEEQNPVHTYEKAGLYIVTLYIEGPDGKSRMSKVWDVAVR